MRKKFVLVCILFFSCLASFATHTKGGWMYYEYLGKGISDTTKLRYKVVLKVYMICDAGPGQLDQSVNFTFFESGTTRWLQDLTVGLAENPKISNCTLAQCNPCIYNIPAICYMIATYEAQVELAPTEEGYTISYQRCCRINGIVNVNNSNQVGDTWIIKIPGTKRLITAPRNSSPKFAANDTAIVCADNYFEFNFKATDTDGDSLAYSFAPAFIGGSSANPSPPSSATPPFIPVPYKYPYTDSEPLGTGVTINPATGIVSGKAPGSGVYVLTALVKEYRNGIYIGEAQKSLHLQVADCFPIKATLNPAYITCDGFSMAFSNETPNSNIKSYLWIFDDPSSGANNTSTSATPTHVFSDTGVYHIKMYVNLGQPCADSTVSEVKVYPGFFPGFSTTGQCVNTAIQFKDTSKTKYGFVNSWSWTFGDTNTLSDSSHLKNPGYTFTTAGSYSVSLTVTNVLGCSKTISNSIQIINNPIVKVAFKDSSFCGLDSLKLSATANVTGNFSWTPNTSILNSNTATPLVFPKTPTQYVVTFDAGGCFGTDTLTVNPKLDFKTSAIASSNNICEEDTITLKAISNYKPATYLWSPAGSLQNAKDSVTKAFPVNTTNYSVTASWGKNCFSTASIPVPVAVKKLATPNAGPDTSVCKNGNRVLLNATGGDNYIWRPAAGLSNPNVANPTANPSVTTSYIVSAGVAGCSKRREDTVVVVHREPPVISITNDTLICSIDTLQLNSASALAASFSWTPSYNINTRNVPSPLVSPDVPTKYYVRVTDIYQCVNTDSVFVDVKRFVTINAGNDTTICQGDEITLQPISDALLYAWSPPTTLKDGTVKYPKATPLATTTYSVIGNIGKCQSSDRVTITVVPYPKANAGKDAAICIDSSIVLQASGGTGFSWNPPMFLSDASIPNPVAKPEYDMQYIVTVTENSGCPKGVNDTVLVKVFPRIIANAGQDTIVVINQPVQLQGSGGDIYIWAPATGLNNANIVNPVATLRNNQQYIMTAKNAAGCFGTDTMNIVVYKVDAGMYLPNAFTPNNDGLNDIFRPIPLGIKTFLSFKIFDRFGNLIYSTSRPKAGWDGTLNGKPLDQAIFAWVVEAIDYENNKIFKKGSVMLIR